MGRQKLPIEIVQARGKKHLTKAEIQHRQITELKPVTDEILPPDYLTKKQKDEFNKIANQLMKLKIMGETDTDALGRYITANDMYTHAVKMMRRKDVREDVFKLEAWSKLQDRYFKQCQSSANALGLTITSRCKLVVPETEKEKPKANKFAKFEKASNG